MIYLKGSEYTVGKDKKGYHVYLKSIRNGNTVFTEVTNCISPDESRELVCDLIEALADLEKSA